MPQTEGKPIWFTEVGASVCNPGTGLVEGNYPNAEASQDTGAKRLLALIDHEAPRVDRTYYYFFSAANQGQVECPNSEGKYKLDTALFSLSKNGPRPAFSTLFPGAVNPPWVSTLVRRM